MLEAVAFLLVDSTEVNRDEKSGDTEGGEHHESPGVVELVGSLALVGVVEDNTDKCREETKTDILNPEDSCVGGADNLLVDQLRHRGPEGCGNQREASTKNEDGHVSHNDTSDRRAGGYTRQDESEGQVADNEQ